MGPTELNEVVHELMRRSRRKFTREFKEAAVKRLEKGASTAEVASSYEITMGTLQRWRREIRNYGATAFPGIGKSRHNKKARTHVISFRITQDEYTHLMALCSRLGARSLADFARSRTLRGASSRS